jgi:hypothetical protein
MRELHELLALMDAPDETAPVDTPTFVRKLVEVITGAYPDRAARSIPPVEQFHLTRGRLPEKRNSHNGTRVGPKLA